MITVISIIIMMSISALAYIFCYTIRFCWWLFTLPFKLIGKLIEKIRYRPMRIGVSTIEKELGLPGKSIYKMKECLKVIQSFEESTEEYWARELVWAMGELDKKGEKLYWRRLRELTNMRRTNFENALP